MRVAVLLLVIAGCLSAADSALQVRELVERVRAGLRAGRPDSEIARTVLEARVVEKVAPAVAEQLQTEGAGPRTLEVLEAHERITEKMALPVAGSVALFEAPPVPDEAEQGRVIASSRAAAMKYTAGLPDFICTQTVRRFVDSGHKEKWKSRDTLTISTAFTDKGERYKLLAVNGGATTRSLSQVGGFRSGGEFGSVLRSIFRDESHAQFRWDRWSKLRGRLSYVFSYRIAVENSTYTMRFNSMIRGREGRAGMTGFVWVDQETGRVMRLSAGAESLPADWPIQGTSSRLDYAFAEVGGSRYLLPQRVESRVVLKRGQSRNIIEFTDYRRFSSDVTLSFESEVP